MPVPLLGTKVYRPRPRAGVVARPHLRERLDLGARAKLLLVSAPAGFGKTTLLTEWLDAKTDVREVAWLSLDRGDSDPASFWCYVIAALQTVTPDLGANELAQLSAPQPPPIEVVLTTLLNDLGVVGTEIVLVLDDYHLVESRDVQEAMAFLLDHLPPRLHVVIASRADPGVPLARLRARGELVEIRAAELRFTPDEVATYLNEAMGLQLSAENVAVLEERTEGWIAALQLAALSMQGRDDVTGFIDEFAGDDRYIVDYLVEEVLQRQATPVRDFLLQTSLLGRLNGSLCDAVTHREGGRAILESLDRGNLFLVPLDDQRQWYRYHHLFADVLRSRLVDESPELVQALHQRACDWYATHGHTALAIEHAMAAGQVERAAELVELALPAMARDRQEAQVRLWVARLPEDVVAVRPVLSNGYAGALMSTGQFDGVERHLLDAERGLDEPLGRVVADEKAWAVLPAGIAVHRAGLALAMGDPAVTVAQAQRALDLLDGDHHLGRAAANALIGLVSWHGGDLAVAGGAYAKSLDHMLRAGHLADVMGLSLALADIQITQGHLRAATRTFERALQLNAPGEPALRGTADMYVGLSGLALERNDLPAATGFLARAEELGEHNGLPQNPYRWRVTMARIREAEGDLAGAVELLDEAERVYVGDFSPNARPVPAVRARVWIRQQKLEDAVEWATGRTLEAEDELSYLREYEHVTLARALLAQGSVEEVRPLLGRLLHAATEGGRTGTVIEVLVLQALVARRTGDLPGAQVLRERASSLGEREGYVRVFVEDGAPTEPRSQGLVDPLSPRELDVLRLLATDLGGPEIAEHLVVSLNTVRTHTKNIYAKLGANNRRAAVRRGNELGLITRSTDL